MTHRQIILAQIALLAGGQFAAAQQSSPTTAPVAIPYAPPAAPQPVFAPSGPYLAAPQVVQPAQQIVPVYPPQSTVVPLPSQTPGSVFGPPLGAPAPQPGAPAVWGNAQTIPAPPVGVLPEPPPIAATPANSIAVPVTNEELAWDQIVDVVSDYFTVVREQQAQRSGEVWTEGRIDTAPQDGATWLEPHRHDSVGTFNRWESTFQTIRRRAVVRVIPDSAGYLVEVVVEKELEDLPAPEKATVGPISFRHDGSLPSRRQENLSRTPSSPRWLQLGRDPALEQRMLADIHARLSGVATSGSVFTR